MKNKLIYLSSKDLDSKVLKEEYENLIRAGYGVTYFMAGDMSNITSMLILERADILCFIGDWKGEERTKREYKIATSLRKKVFFSASELNRYLIHGDQ